MEKWGGIVQTLLNTCILPFARPNFELSEGKRRNKEENATFHVFLTLTGSRL